MTNCHQLLSSYKFPTFLPNKSTKPPISKIPLAFPQFSLTNKHFALASAEIHLFKSCTFSAMKNHFFFADKSIYLVRRKFFFANAECLFIKELWQLMIPEAELTSPDAELKTSKLAFTTLVFVLINEAFCLLNVVAEFTKL